MIHFGIVEDRNDPLKIGRCKVRVVGLHSQSKIDIPTESLPWAYPIQPITSAGISGVGHAPIGLVEGSWVCVIFKDKAKQIPIILGSVGGIPNDGEVESIQYKTTNELTNVKPVSQIEKYSDDILLRIKVLEMFKPSAVLIPADRTSNDVDWMNFMPDVVSDLIDDIASQVSTGEGFYVIGYKSRTLLGIKVMEGQTITLEQAEVQLKLDLDLVFKNIKQLIRAPVTQSMMDALVLFVYDIGINAFKSSKVLSEINTSNYNQAATSMVIDYGKKPKEKSRREIEKQLFLKDPLPNQPSVNTVIDTTSLTDDAFNTSSGVYPKYKNEPDTNKLARHEDVGSTIVVFKEAARVTGVPIANGGTWDQPNIPYNADYPFNKIFASETGHLLEFDDTEGSERIHIFHKSGTFTEIDGNGSQVNRIVGDNYEIMERNGHVYVRGSLHVNVEGASSLKVSNTLDVEVSGATNVNILNDANLNVSGDANLAVLGALKIKSNDAIKIEGKSVDIKSEGAIKITSATDIGIKSTGKLKMAYASASFGTTAPEAEQTGLKNPKSKQTTSPVEFSPLVVPTRTFREAITFEAPDEGDSTAFVESRIAGGTLPKSEAAPVTQKDVKETKTVPKNTAQPPVQSCDVIFGMTEIPRNLQLSKNYNLLDLTAKGSRPVVNQMGLTKQQIVCNLKGLCENCLEPIKSMYPNIIISSGFRRPGDVANSAKRSQHYNGEAADLVFTGFSKKQVYDAIIEIQKVIPYDQLLLEFSGANTVWVHVSFKYSGGRKQSFTMKNHQVVPGSEGKYVLV